MLSIYILNLYIKRNNNDKTSGRKRPRINDIVPAPDSILADLEETNLDIENLENSVKFTSSTPNKCLTPAKPMTLCPVLFGHENGNLIVAPANLRK